ncbi:Mechanosensitive channel MscK [Calidithermus terrae]|uniref:Mechanosensitive channel MscK n=1 Tax=Calidithermus terrae TaxID=1408545 RepID=A0A399EA95_9DEIN|nr:mechanosensitive ion channel family protein [Calidithermus terrae]RIH81634.1 Mechanosensitive channel MscK [Calidithermus terrae]
MVDFSLALKRAHTLLASLVANLPNILVGLLVLTAFVLISRLVPKIIGRLLSGHRNAQNLSYVLSRLASWVVVTAGVFLSLSLVVPSLSVGDLVQLLGVTSVAVGFAFRDIFQNFLAGILLLLTQPFSLGDRIQVKGYEGRVEDIQTRATRIRSDEGETVIIPNATLFTESVVVRRPYQNRRLEVDVNLKGVALERVRPALLEAVRRVPGVLHEPPPQVLVAAIAPDSLTLRLRWWILGGTNGLESKDRVLEAAQRVLAQAAAQPQPSA